MADGGVEPAGLLVGRLQVPAGLVEVVGGFGAAGGGVVGVGVLAQDAPVGVVAGRRGALVGDVGQGAGQLVQDGSEGVEVGRLEFECGDAGVAGYAADELCSGSEVGDHRGCVVLVGTHGCSVTVSVSILPPAPMIGGWPNTL